MASLKVLVTTIVVSFACMALGSRCQRAEGAAPGLHAVPFDNGVLIVNEEREVFLRVRPTAWGSSWYWLPGRLAQDGNSLAGVHECQVGSDAVRFAVRITPVGSRRIDLSYELTALRECSLNVIAVSADLGLPFRGKDRVQINSPAGQAAFDCPVPTGVSVQAATAAVCASSEGTTALHMDPAIDVRGGAAVQLLLGEGNFAAGQTRKLTISLDLPADYQWCATPAELPDEPGIEKWFPWQPKQDVEGDESVIGMQAWLDPITAPADRIVNRDGRLMRGDRPIRLWGINSNYIENFPEKAEGARRAAWFAKYGINCVRLHKMSGSCTWAGMRSRESCLKFDPAKLDNLDSYTAELRKRGVYYAFSPNYPFTVGVAERDRVESWEEIASGSGQDIEGVAGDLIWASPKMQGLLIEQICVLLNHVNPYTGLAYKDDPALAYVECINEQSVLFYSNMPAIAKKPTYKRLMAERFSDWLKQKYGSHEALVKTWGEGALKGCYDSDPDEHLDKRNIFPGGSPWFWDPAQMAGSHQAYARRFLDHMVFLAQLQDEFYSAWTAAVRQTGYQGMTDCSNWQAGRMFSHYYNLRYDALGDIIDRHNYFGGVLSGFNLVLGDFNNDSMLARPGSGSLSSGLQQVEGRAFGLSEWIHCLPNEWGVEELAIHGAYGFGLQGWDTSFIFTQAGHQFPDRIDGYIWNAFVPTIMGAFPAISRQVLRGDVEESPVLSTRRVCTAQFAEGQGIDFEDTTTQSHDVKSFDCDRAGTPTVHVLDHDGRRTGRTVPAKDGRIALDGAENKTIYYEIEYR